MSFGESHHPLQSDSIMRGRIANTPANEDADLWVTVPSFHHSERWGPCPFAPRVNAAGAQALPSSGDDCLVALDEHGNGYCILWWPA
jgi:hypothetical protein